MCELLLDVAKCVCTMGYVNKKVRKTFYIPQWVCDQLEGEGEQYGGPGVVVAAAIAMFCCRSKEEKAGVLKAYREQEIDRSYEDENEDDPQKKWIRDFIQDRIAANPSKNERQLYEDLLRMLAES